jgi:predicted dehydrogenase
MAKAHWHKKTSWRTTSPNPAREKELNWRLDKTVSLGLAGELGIHPIDQAGWYFNKRPVAITGFGSIVYWNKENKEAADDREVPDTIQAIIEYPRGVRMMYDATLANTFDSECEVLYGSDAAVMMRESRAWAFKEVDSRLWGWEVYARKETFFEDTGIALVADASKAPPVKTDKSVEAPPYSNTPLYFALSAFLRKAAAIDDFISTFGADDLSGLPDHLSRSHLDPAAGYLEGYQATVTAIKANEAIVTGKRIELKPEWYELG